VELVEDLLSAGGVELSLLRPPDAEALIDEEAFEHEEFLPYWAELWPSGLALAEALAARDLEGLRVVELGCGLAVPSLVAALRGAEVLATDWSPAAIDLLGRNADRNGARLESGLVSWAEPAALLERAPYDLVVAADVLYERRNGELLLELLPRLGPEVLLADPGRPALGDFLAAAAERWTVEAAPPLYRLS
jgi:predicted nicotinamide N-methyase